MKRFLILVIVFGLPLSFWGQGRDENFFSHSSFSFVSEVGDYLMTTSNQTYRDNANELLRDFSVSWQNFSNDEQSMIMDFCDDMVARHVKAFPVFYNYVAALVAVANAEMSEESVESWLNSTKYIFENKPRRNFTNHIEFSYDFFSKGILNKSGGARWRLRNGVYELIGDTVFMLKVMSGDLVCHTIQDSAEIHNTYGTFDGSTGKFYGHQGRVDWSRYNVDPLIVFATLGNYVVNVKQPEYTADSVVYYNKYLFDKPLHGTLKDKPSTVAPNSRTDYPQFTSYEERDIADYYRNISYRGHVFVTGSNFNVTGTAENKAVLTVNKKGRRVLELQSMMFKMYEGKVVSDKVSMLVFLGNDTIRHPYLGLRYEDAKRKMMLYFPRNDMSKLPFTDTYHGVNIYFDAFNWDIDTNEAAFQQMESQTTDSRGYFSSLNYFRKNEFDKMKGLDVSHPIYKVAAYLYDYNTNEVSINDFSAYAKKSIDQSVSLFITLSSMGYMEYDPDTQTGTVTPLFYKAIKARRGSTDYDIIKIRSYTSNRTPNMVLNMTNYDMVVNGVQPIVLSDIKQVNMVPDSGRIVLKSDRNFVFAGKVNAGLFEFFSHENSFNYSEFRLDLPTIDSISFYVNRGASSDPSQRSLVRVKNVISDLSGILIIDDKKNRSGSMQYPEYPKFICNQESYVYFDKKSINEGKLTRDKFKYIVEPFEIDSLMTFTTDGLHFPGRLVSPIFPDIHQKLGVMGDYSLGFENVSGDGGYPMYGGKGTYYNDIHLSNRGFYGNGKIRYCNSVYTSDKHKFYFDAVVSKTTAFAMEKRVKGDKFPEASGDVMRFRWNVYQAYVELNTIQTPVHIFGKTDFYGKLVVKPTDMKGEGQLVYNNSALTSGDFSFDNVSLVANASNFVLRNDQSDSVFLADNYRTSMDFEKNLSVFNYLDEASNLKFPMNMFACTLDEAAWDMSKEVITISNRDKTYEKQLVNVEYNKLIDIEFDGSRFISLHPDHDSLTFYCLNADYNLNDYSVNCRDVKIIKIGNIAVFPGDGLVSIGRSAAIRPIEGATIIGDIIDRKYTFTNAHVNIYGKNNYNADGWCNYVSADGTATPIFFPSIEPVEEGKTRALAQISETDNFMLSPYFAFMGNVVVNMDESFMHFNGKYKMTHDCVRKLPWLSADTVIDPADIRIPVALGDKNPNILNGLYYDRYTEKHIAALLSPARADLSYDTLNYTQGVLSYDKESQSYLMEGVDNKGIASKINFIPRLCQVVGEGNMEIGTHGTFVDVVSNGIYKFNLADDSISFNVALAIKLPFEDNLAHYMADSLADSDHGTLELDRTTYLNIVRAKATKNEFERVEREVEQFGHPRRMPSIFDESLVLSDVDLVWNGEENSFLSVGKIGVASVHRSQVNMYVDGYVEIRKRSRSDVITAYLEPAPGTWFFLHYENNILQMMSSSKAFNRRVVAIKEKNRQYEDKKSGQKYEYVISTIMKVNNFVRRMKVLHGEVVEEEEEYYGD